MYDMSFNPKILNKFTLLLIFLIVLTSNHFAQSNSTKSGGVSFRVDDNGLISQYRDYANLFNKYGNKFNFAMNLSNNEFETLGYADSIREFQSQGHLLMDHTPSHATNYFITKFNTTNYDGVPGVDHISGDKICLMHEQFDTSAALFSGTADIEDNKIYFSSTDYHILTHWQELDREGVYFYFPSLDTLVLVYDFNHSHKTGIFLDIWAENLTLPQGNSLKYYSFDRNQITITQEAFSLLVSETLKLCEPENYNLQPPTIWIQPGGNFPVFESTEIKTPLELLGFTGAATYPNEANKVFNEYNPNNDREYAFQWGDFVEDEMSLQQIQARIADGVAKHKVMINNIHWYSNVASEWDDYIAKMDSLLLWIDTNSITIDTYDKWINKLYNETQDPYENVIPTLSNDFDGNSIPDGYQNIYWMQTAYTGTWLPDATAPDGYAYSSDYYDQYRRICIIQDLGGIEKGENDFSIWTKGEAGNSVRVIVEFDSDISPGTIEFQIPADTPQWRKYDLSQSANSNKSLIVPSDASLINFDFVHKTTSIPSAAEIRIGGMSLSKKIALDSLQFTILNNDEPAAGDSIIVEIELIDQFGNPKITSYEYNITLPDTSSAELITQDTLWFNNSSKDTIIIKDTTAGFLSFTANISHLPNISGQKTINILPSIPKHLTIISNSDPIVIGEPKTIKAAIQDSFMNSVADSLITFQALNGNGQFSNNLQSITVPTNSSGIAEAIYTASNTLNSGYDSIQVSYNSTLIDTIIFPLLEAPISKLVLNPMGTNPYYDNDTIKVEITAKDKFDNFVVNSDEYLIRFTGSNSAKLFSSNDFAFNNNSLDTLFLSDSLAGNFNLIVKLKSDTLIADTTTIGIEYSKKFADIKIFLEGAYNQTESKMDTSIIEVLPLISPYSEALDTVIAIPSGTIDWVLVTLRKDIDEALPNPETAVDYVVKSALVDKFGIIRDPQTFQNVSFKVPCDMYYIVIKHRNHLPIMSSQRIYLNN